MADIIAKHANLRAMVRVSLLPLVGFSWATLRFGMVITILFILILISSLIAIVILKKKENPKICLTF
jgi:hypothetical protein